MKLTCRLPMGLLLLGLLTAFAPGDCLLSYQTKLDQLLPKATIETHYKGDLSNAKLSYVRTGKTGKYDTYKYMWASGVSRPMKVMGHTVDAAIPHEIGVGWLQEVNPRHHPDALRYFRDTYRTPTDEEIRRTNEYVNRELAKKMDEKGTPTDMDKKAGKTTADIITNQKPVFRNVSGLGTAAAWNATDQILHVLVGRIEFKIR